MSQIVFIHGPGAGQCSDAWLKQLEHFPGSIAPDLPGRRHGANCPDIPRYTDWVRGWLWAQGFTHDLVLVGYTMGSAIALQYGLDYPDEVRALVLTTAGFKANLPPPGRLELRLKAAAGDQDAYKEWFDFNQGAMKWVEPGFRDLLMQRHREVGPMSQHNDLKTLFAWGVEDRVGTLKPKLLLVRGTDDFNTNPNTAPDRDDEFQKAVPGSQLVFMERAGHFPATENPAAFNKLLEEFLAGL